MKVQSLVRGLVVATILAMLGALLPQLASAAPEKASGRYLVRARSSADYAALRAKAVKDGARVVRDLRQVNTMVVSAPSSARASLAADRRTLGVARSRLRKLTAEVGAPNLDAPGLRGATQLKAKAPAAAAAAGINPDPACDYKGLLWDYRRIGLPQGWKTSAGSSGGDRRRGRHRPRLHPQRARPQGQAGGRLHRPRGPPGTARGFGVSDEDLAATSSAARLTTDWNGHGSWIGGRIAAALDGTGINGIAPKVNLVALKISQWCGSANDDELLAAFMTAADMGLDVVNISFGGSSDISTPEGQAIYQAYIDTDRLRPQQGHDHRRLGRQRGRPASAPAAS